MSKFDAWKDKDIFTIETEDSISKFIRGCCPITSMTLALNSLLCDEYMFKNLVITHNSGVYYIDDGIRKPCLEEFLPIGNKEYYEDDDEEEVTTIEIDLFFWYELFSYMKDVKEIDDLKNKIEKLLNSITKDNVIIEEKETDCDDKINELHLTYIAKIKQF